MVRSKKIVYSLVALGVLGAGIIAQWQWQQHIQDHPKLVALDVGQGDAIYLHTQQGADVLIDGGPDRRVLERLGQVMPFWDRTIELVVLTHPHADHLNGLLTLLDYYQVQDVWLAQVQQERNPTYQLWLQQLADHHVTLHYARAGDQWLLSDQESFRVLYPFTDTSLDQLEDLNDTSVVMEYELAQYKVLFMGDATSLVETQLLTRQAITQADILKVGHHGSRYSSAPEFLAVVQPKYAIISAGIDNSYHHPHAETIQRLQAVGASILRTDQQGIVELGLAD